MPPREETAALGEPEIVVDLVSEFVDLVSESEESNEEEELQSNDLSDEEGEIWEDNWEDSESEDDERKLAAATAVPRGVVGATAPPRSAALREGATGATAPGAVVGASSAAPIAAMEAAPAAMHPNISSFVAGPGATAEAPVPAVAMVDASARVPGADQFELFCHAYIAKCRRVRRLEAQVRELQQQQGGSHR